MNEISNFATSTNHQIYRSKALAEKYAAERCLQPPEATILRILLPKLQTVRMLDIGVGGGRTTRHFAPLVSEYTGIDYSEAMVEICRSQFSGSAWKFEVADVRELRDYQSRSFDLVLFSYNGIDYITHPDRLRALQEISRVLKPGGTFAFSTHNLYALEAKFKNTQIGKLRMRLGRIRWSLQYWWHNDGRRPSGKDDYLFIKDGALDFGLHTYYVRPSSQVNCLLSLGFDQIQLFQLSNGCAIDASQLSSDPEDWFYVLCTKR